MDGLAIRPPMPEAGPQVFRHKRQRLRNGPVPAAWTDAAARYRVVDRDTQASLELAGAELMDPGLPVTLSSKASAAILIYQHEIAGRFCRYR